MQHEPATEDRSCTANVGLKPQYESVHITLWIPATEVSRGVSGKKGQEMAIFNLCLLGVPDSKVIHGSKAGDTTPYELAFQTSQACPHNHFPGIR